jgi:hypothetical protein
LNSREWWVARWRRRCTAPLSVITRRCWQMSKRSISKKQRERLIGRNDVPRAKKTSAARRTHTHTLPPHNSLRPRCIISSSSQGEKLIEPFECQIVRERERPFVRLLANYSEDVQKFALVSAIRLPQSKRKCDFDERASE